MNNFVYYSPTKVLFGSGTVEQVGDCVRSFGGTHALIVYGSERTVKSGLLMRVLMSLEKAGVGHTALGGVVPNPRISKGYEGIALGQQVNADFLLAIGGGSVIDTAKAIAYGMGEPDKDVWELYAHTRTAKAMLPVGSILTIAASGSETSNSSVLTKEDTGDKRSYNDDIARPRFAIMDPSLTLSLPDYQSMSGCADIMMHTMERYFVNGGNLELTDSLAEGLLRTVMAQARILHREPENLEARAEVMWAGSLAHNNLTGCGIAAGDFVCHGLEHELGGMFDVTHGAGLTAVWGSWARYVYRDCLHRFVRYAREVMQVEPGESDEETALRGIEAMEAFYREIGMPTNLRELGVEPTDEQMREMAHRCAVAHGGKKGSAKVFYEEDMYKVYKMAL